MSAPPKFAKLADAIAAYLAGRSRRWAEVDGWQIDLLQAQAPCVASRPGADEPRGYLTGSLSLVFVTSLGRVVPMSDPPDREAHDRAVAANVRAELARASEVLPDLVVPSEVALDASVHRCPWCSRPWDGAK